MTDEIKKKLDKITDQTALIGVPNTLSWFDLPAAKRLEIRETVKDLLCKELNISLEERILSISLESRLNLATEKLCETAVFVKHEGLVFHTGRSSDLLDNELRGKEVGIENNDTSTEGV